MLHRGRILVVDDERDLRELTTAALEAEGHSVLVADNGARALELLAIHSVDAIVLDMMMPTLDGWGFIERHRELRGDNVGLVCVSAAMNGPTAERLRALGVHSCVAKPFDLDELVGCVAHVIADTRRPRQRKPSVDA
jgi:CheY-like chemotaxis protein